MKKNIKDFIELIKDKLSNKRTRAITILSLYFVFFALLFVLISINPNKNLSNDNVKENIINNTSYSNLSFNYSYKYTIEIQTQKEVNKYMITGKYINNETDYIIKKLIKDEYKQINEFDLINVDIIYIENILKYISNKDYEYQTKYKDGRILDNYVIPINEINKYYIKKDNIDINIESKDDFINKISFDSTKLDNFLNKDIILSKYILEYEKDEN